MVKNEYNRYLNLELERKREDLFFFIKLLGSFSNIFYNKIFILPLNMFSPQQGKRFGFFPLPSFNHDLLMKYFALDLPPSFQII